MIYLMFEYQLNLRLCSICKRVINQYRKKHFRRSGDTLYPCFTEKSVGGMYSYIPSVFARKWLKTFQHIGVGKSED